MGGHEGPVFQQCGACFEQPRCVITYKMYTEICKFYTQNIHRNAVLLHPEMYTQTLKCS